LLVCVFSISNETVRKKEDEIDRSVLE